QDAAVGGHDRHLGLVGSQDLGQLSVAKPFRLVHRDALRLRPDLHRRRREFAASAPGAVGLGDHRHQVRDLGGGAGDRHGEFGGAEEDGAPLHGAQSSSFAPHLPVKRGARFSRKAATPSMASAVAAWSAASSTTLPSSSSRPSNDLSRALAAAMAIGALAASLSASSCAASRTCPASTARLARPITSARAPSKVSPSRTSSSARPSPTSRGSTAPVPPSGTRPRRTKV